MQDSGAARTESSPLLKLLLLIAVLCIAACILIFSLLADRTPVLDLQVLQAQRALWSEHGPEDYDLSLSIHVDRQQESLATVSVRNGKLVSQTYNGLPRPAKDDSYTIEGLFRTMERELLLAEETKRKGGTVLKAAFDGPLGIPLVFKRLTTRQGSRSCIISLRQLSSPESGSLLSAGQP